MPGFEERAAQLEVKVDQYDSAVTDLKAAIVALDQKMERGFEALEHKMERGFEALEQKMERRFGALEQKMETRFAVFDQRFFWVIGAQFATLLAIIAGMAGIIAKLL